MCLKLVNNLFYQVFPGLNLFVYKMTSANSLDFDVIREWSNIRKYQKVPIKNLLRQFYAAYQFKIISVDRNKVKIITSENDGLCSWNCGYKIAKAFDCEFYKIKGGRLALDNPKELANIINSYS